MARGTQASPPLSSLPKVEFQKIDDDVSTQPCGVHDGQARAFGYNDFSEFQRPDSYIRHIEPLESELAKQVEYDMDEQDKEWLDSLNRERRKEQLSQISYELFEVVMDRLEKEWFDLTKNIPKPDFALPSEDSTCAICDDSEGENSNAIVFCDGCNLAVHQDCYGVPYIPEGQWLCRKCTVSPENPVSCVLCPNEGGAFKQTVQGDWVHLLCAIWVPETRVANDVFMEPITGVDKISKQRWKLKCNICDIREGACIQCAKTSCFLAFHTTCARQERLLLPMKSAQGTEPVTLTAYCDRHLPKEQQDARAAALAADEALEDSPGHTAKLAKSARAYAKTYEPGPPLVPAIIVSRIEFYTRRFKLSKRLPTLQMMCRYWSLKREARRGAPLLKRLHLEPWTASAGGKVQTEEEKLMKLDQLKHLLFDMEGLRDLTLAMKKRERWKLEQARAIYDVLENSLFIHERALRAAFEKIMTVDRHDYFKNPVSKAEVPDYFDVVKNPMCWTMIETKLDKHEYWDVQAFKDDIDLVVNNAILYNKPGTAFHKAALRIQTAAAPILDELRKLSAPSPDSTAATVTASTTTDAEASSSQPQPQPQSAIGDLEPPLELLELLLSADAIKDDINLVLDDTPLASLFSFELPKLKPPPPPPPPAPPKLSAKAKAAKLKRDRKAEYAKRKAVKEAEKAAAAQAEVDAAPVAIQDEVVAVVEAEAEAKAGEAEAATTEAEMAAAEDAQVEGKAVATAGAEVPQAEAATAEAEAEAQAQAEVAQADTTAAEATATAEAAAPITEGAAATTVEEVTAATTADTETSTVTTTPIATMAPAEPKKVDGLSKPRTRRAAAAVETEIQATEESSTAPAPTDQQMPMEDRQPSEDVVPESATSTSAMPGPGPSKRGRRPVRQPSVGRVEMPPLVDNVDNQKSFKMFNKGWIFPPDQRRGGRAPVERQSVSVAPRPRKRMRTDPGPSRLSMVSTVASDNQTFDEGTPGKLSTPVSTPDDAMEVDEPPVIEDTPSQAPLSVTRPRRMQQPTTNAAHGQGRGPELRDFPMPREPRQIVTLPNGKVVIEELDTPAIRKQKALRRKEERERMKLAEEQAAAVQETRSGASSSSVPPLPVVGASVSAPVRGRKRRGRKKKNKEKDTDEMDSDLSDLSDYGSERIANRKAGSASGFALPTKAVPVPGQIILVGGKSLEGGTLVWAKYNTYPWWPAVIYEDNDMRIPPSIVEGYQKEREKQKTVIHILQFFDSKKSWQYLPLDRLRMLGEDKALDEELLASNSKRQKWRSPAMRDQCREYYKVALDEMETRSDLDRNEAAAAAAAATAGVAEGQASEPGAETVETQAVD